MKGQFVIKTSNENITFISKEYDDYDEMEEKVYDYISGAHDAKGNSYVTVTNYKGKESILQGGHFLYPNIIELNKGE